MEKVVRGIVDKFMTQQQQTEAWFLSLKKNVKSRERA